LKHSWQPIIKTKRRIAVTQRGTAVTILTAAVLPRNCKQGASVQCTKPRL